MSRFERWSYRLSRLVNLSSILIIAGLILLALGGLTFYRQYRPADPPPELAQEPTALPPTPEPSATPTLTPYPTYTLYPTYTPYPEEPTPTPSPTPLRPPAQELPGRIVIPSIGVDSPIVEVGWSVIQNSDGKFTSVWDTADYAVGYHKTSGLPGNIGNCVLSGHNNIKGEVFKNLSDVKPGDMIYLYAEGYEYQYKVESAFIVQEVGASEEQRRKNVQWIAPTSDERLTLVSCWPYWSNTHRVIVVAKPYIPPTPTPSPLEHR